MRAIRFVLLAVLAVAAAKIGAQTVVLAEPGMMTADTAALAVGIAAGQQVDARGLAQALAAKETRLLVLPYGSCFPEESFGAIERYLRAGGNLLVIGGRAFSCAAYREGGAWKQRPESQRYARVLGIDAWEETPGSADLQTQGEFPLAPWLRGFSPVVHLSTTPVSERAGASGNIDAVDHPLLMGEREGRRLSVAAESIDHLSGSFAAGRWVFLNGEFSAETVKTEVFKKLVELAAEYAGRGVERLTAEIELPAVRPGEANSVELEWISPAKAAPAIEARLQYENEPAVPLATEWPNRTLRLPAQTRTGLYHLTLTAMIEGKAVARAETGFWVARPEDLERGPKLGVDGDFFTMDGKAFPVVGTTYMASDAQRMFFAHPNPATWERDLGQIADAGLNMIRTGWWSDWQSVADETGRPRERALRSMEAYLLSCQRHGLPVQWNLFAFLPDVFGGSNAYLDPDARRRQQRMFAGLVDRFGRVPFLAWDLINEPSWGHLLWTGQPNGDALELALWNGWLKERYATRAELAEAWGIPVPSEDATLPVPTADEYRWSGPGSTSNVHDFYLFQQDEMREWVRGMAATLRSHGSEQLVTVGQDEGGVTNRLPSSYFAGQESFTVNHWWHMWDQLWDSLAAKLPGKTALIQEMGASNPELYERKTVMAFARTAGVIDWLWNSNTYMMDDGEVALGSLRADGSERKQAGVLRRMGAWAKECAPLLRRTLTPEAVVIAAQAGQLSTLNEMEVAAQQRAVAALGNANGIAAAVLPDNHMELLGSPKLVVLPSAQRLDEPVWNALLFYVRQGGTLLITGPVERDAHGLRVERMAGAGLKAELRPLLDREAAGTWFDQNVRETAEALRFGGGATEQRLQLGAGKILWEAYPLELGNNPAATAAVYRRALEMAGVSPAFTAEKPLDAGVLVFPLAMEHGTLYLFSSTSVDAAELALKDKRTGARIALRLRSGHAAMRFVDEQGNIRAPFGGE